MTNTCEIVNFLTQNVYEKLPTAQFLNDTLGIPELSAGNDTHVNATLNELTFAQMVEFTFNTIAHSCMIFIMVGMTYTCVVKLKLQKTAMHAFLCTLGLFMLTEGVQVRYQRNPIFYNLSSDTQNIIHVCLQVGGGLIGLGGTAHKYMMKKTHFHTNHGKFGGVSLVFWLTNVLAGLLAFFMDSSIVSIVHNIIGLFTYSFFMFAQWIGYDSGFFRRNFDNPKSYKTFTVLTLFLSVIGPVQLFVNKFFNF